MWRSWRAGVSCTPISLMAFFCFLIDVCLLLPAAASSFVTFLFVGLLLDFLSLLFHCQLFDLLHVVSSTLLCLNLVSIRYPTIIYFNYLKNSFKYKGGRTVSNCSALSLSLSLCLWAYFSPPLAFVSVCTCKLYKKAHVVVPSSLFHRCF